MVRQDGEGQPVEFSLQLYEELKSVARSHLSRRRAGRLVNTTTLVHETYLRLLNRPQLDGAHRPQLFAVAARAMRSVLVDHARRRRALKRNAVQKRIPLDDVVDQYDRRSGDLVALDEALAELAAFDQRSALLVELRFFGGLTVEDTAAALNVSDRTVRRDWKVVKAWLRDAIGREIDHEGPSMGPD